jgi:hypothetical protein
MRLGAKGWFGVGTVTCVLAGCQGSSPGRPEATATLAAGPAAAEGSAPQEQPATAIDWAGAGDCLAQLRLLHAAAVAGSLEARHQPPFAVLQGGSKTGLEWIQAAGVPLVEDLPLPQYDNRGAAAAAAPCLLLVEPARELRTASRVIDFQDVASLYQSTVRTERNPEYDAARTRLREAERDSKSSGPDLLRVGDPMLDLVGLVVGGVIAAFGQIGDNTEVDDALAELKETPRSRDRPIYRAYEFERSTVRAGKEAIIPVALQDVRRGHVWRSQVRQRELRQFAVLEGLDPRDRDYEQHRAGALSWREFEHWQRQPPQLPLSALVAALVEAGAAAPPRAGEAELVAAAPAELEPAAGPPDRLPPARVALGAPLRVAAPSTPVGAERPPRAAPDAIGAVHDPCVASCVRLRAEGRPGNGFYVRPRLVVTAADVVGTASVIDVTTSDGEEALGLVVLVDQIRGLAVVHVPRAGQPMAFAESAGLEPGRTARVIGLGADGRARSGSAVFEPAPAVGAIDEGIARAPRLKLDDGGEPAAPGAVVVSENHVIGLLAGGEGGPMRGILPIDGLSQLLESETLAGLP